MSPIITSLHFYPVKSCKAIDLETAYVSPRGLMVGDILDRSWMLYNEHGVLVSQREEPSLARVKIELIYNSNGVADKLRASVNDMPGLILDPALVENEQRKLTIHGNKTTGHVAPREISEWFSSFLKRPVGVAHQKESDVRPVDPNYAQNPETDVVSFADGYQCLITTEATLEHRNKDLEKPVTMRHYRPNIVLGNTAPNAECTWRHIQAGEAAFALNKPCTRCPMIDNDPDAGVSMGTATLDMLKRDAFISQQFNQKRLTGAIFGENGIPTAFGKISVGDMVRVMAEKPMYQFIDRSQRAAAL